MRLRWSVILPVIGLILFTAVTIRSARLNDHDASHPHKYFWWSSLRLDSDPLNRHPLPEPPDQPCKDGTANCSEWKTLPDRWARPGLLDRALVISGFPAFLAGAAIVAICSKQGVDEVLAFMVSMPILLFGWYFLAGWLLEKVLYRRAMVRSTPLKLT